MKLAALILLAVTQITFAADRNPLETVDQARQRQSAENYETYRKQDNQLLPPSYNRPMGDTEQRGVERPGYVSPQPSYQPAPTYGGGGDWRDRAKGR